jgi:hypothetical protein
VTTNLLDALTVGEATVRTLEAKRIPFQGTERAINTIMNTPGQDQTLEILSDKDMRAYG